MKEYNLYNHYFAKHKVQITLQEEDYIGHVIFEMGGNCKGLDILCSANFEDETFENAENDCKLQYIEDGDYFEAYLKNKNGDELLIEEDGAEMNKRIVAIEIISFEKDDN